MTSAAASTHLDQIVARTRSDLSLRRTASREQELEALAAQHIPRGFAGALLGAAQMRPAVIAELKKASPSKGLICPNFDPATLATSLESSGAACLSVLTDKPFFQGSLQNLRIASSATTLPCLRKDFIVDEFQILEARAHQADAILLIAAALTDTELKHLRTYAHDLQMDVLCEVHNRIELDRVLPLGCEMYGVNSRDLRTFAVDVAASEDLAQHLPENAVRVAESGLGSYADIQRMQRAGYNAFLIGESLMRATNPGEALTSLLHAPAEA